MRRLFHWILSMMTLLLIAGCAGDEVSDSGSTIQASKIIKMIKQGKSVSISNKTITGVLDFTKISSPNKKLDVSSVYIPVEVSFRNCIFEDTVMAQTSDFKTRKEVVSVFERNVNFLECEFRKPLLMRQSDFRGRFDFDISKTLDESDFSGCHFRNGASFCQANFDGDTYFVSCTFDGRSNFFKVLFKNSAVFQYVRFNDATMFSDAHFYGGVDISKVFVASTIDFANTRFSENVMFSNSQYLGDLRLISCNFSKGFTFINNTVYGSLKMAKSHFEKSVVFSNNILLSEPDFAQYEKSEGCEVLQIDNKSVNLIVKQIF